LPTIKSFWSKDEGFNLDLPQKIMPRNRFEILLRFYILVIIIKINPIIGRQRLKIL
jgi:hypothetical protein